MFRNPRCAFRIWPCLRRPARLGCAGPLERDSPGPRSHRPLPHGWIPIRLGRLNRLPEKGLLVLDDCLNAPGQGVRALHEPQAGKEGVAVNSRPPRLAFHLPEPARRRFGQIEVRAHKTLGDEERSQAVAMVVRLAGRRNSLAELRGGFRRSVRLQDWDGNLASATTQVHDQGLKGRFRTGGRGCSGRRVFPPRSR